MAKALFQIWQFNAGSVPSSPTECLLHHAGSVPSSPTECLLHHAGLRQEQLAEGTGKVLVTPLSWLCSCTEFGERVWRQRGCCGWIVLPLRT